MFNWVATMFRGKLSFSTAMLFAVGFLSMFLIGGINGAFLASVPVDYHVHATYLIVAHIHYVLFGGSVMGIFAGIYYWFPKMFGRMLNETLGKIHFVGIFIGMNLTFFPMHLLGHLGHDPPDRRLQRDRRLERPEPGGDDRRLHDRGRRCCRSCGTSSSSLRGGRAGRRRPVGGQHPRVGDLVAAAALELRPPAADPLRAPGLRPAPRRATRPQLDGGALTMAASPSAVTPHAGLAEAHGHAQRGISNPILGMILFIASEVMFFAGLFAAYFNVRLTAAALAAARQRGRSTSRSTSTRPEHLVVPAILTAILVLSSVTMQLGVWAIRRGDRTAFLRATAVTLVLGVVFLGGQVWDYTAAAASGSPTRPSAAPSTR